jgi:hypothetical protein
MMATGTAQVPLRRRLLLLTGAAIVPLAVMSGVGLYALAQQQRVQAERVGLELARAVANAVDAELRNGISALESLATTPTLDRDDYAAFRARALRILDTQDRMLSLAAGYSMHVPKPVDPGELTAIIASVAGRPQPRPG